MGYIGKLPATQGKDAGPALKLDDISSDFDGLTSVFSLAVGGTAVTPHVNNISIYLSGVYQIPGNSYSLSGSFIVFTGAPSSSLDFHGALLGTSRSTAFSIISFIFCACYGDSTDISSSSCTCI